MAQQIDPEAIVKAVKAEVELVVRTVKEKGARRFFNPLAVAGGLILFSYLALYAPPKGRLSTLDKERKRRKSLAEWGVQYKELRDAIRQAYAALPPTREKEKWLSGALIQTLQAENLTPESFRPTTENESNGITLQSSTVEFSFRFGEFYSWLQRIEASRPMMHVQSIEIRKLGAERPGRNSGMFEVVTAIPKTRFDR